MTGLQVRVRYFDIFYHMEDGSMEMVEPQAVNSGLVQGKYLSRHRCVCVCVCVRFACDDVYVHMCVRVCVYLCPVTILRCV